MEGLLITSCQVVANAGVMPPYMPVNDVPISDAEETFRVNVRPLCAELNRSGCYSTRQARAYVIPMLIETHPGARPTCSLPSLPASHAKWGQIHLYLIGYQRDLPRAGATRRCLWDLQSEHPLMICSAVYVHT